MLGTYKKIAASRTSNNGLPYDIVRIGSKRMIQLNQMNQIYNDFISRQVERRRIRLQQGEERKTSRLETTALIENLRNATSAANTDAERINLAALGNSFVNITPGMTDSQRLNFLRQALQQQQGQGVQQQQGQGVQQQGGSQQEDQQGEDPTQN